MRGSAIVVAFVCACGSGSHSSPEVDAGTTSEGPVDVRTTSDPATQDVTVDVLEPGSGMTLVSVRFERATRLLHWTAPGHPTADTGPLSAAVADAELGRVLADTAVLGWGWSLAATGQRNHAPTNCPSFPFRGDHACSVPSAFRSTFDRVCGPDCDTLAQCERHDDCYYDIPLDVCQTASARNPDKRSCDEIFDGVTCAGGGAHQLACREVLKNATSWGGGSGYQAGNPCANENYCGRYNEKECCAVEITGGICASSLPACYCDLCQQIIGPAGRYDVSFPEGNGIDVSACGSSASSFNSQTLMVDADGAFDELWPPPTMDVLRISGTMVHEVHVDGVLGCLAGGASGSFTASWVPLLGRYDGTYDFDGHVGPITLRRAGSP
jgi:hypothetical protein